MELRLTPAQDEWREEVRDFLDAELPARWEKFDVQLFTRRCRHWELDLGDERHHRERIAASLAA